MRSIPNAWSKRLLFEIRLLIREHADKYQHQLSIGQIELLGTALREMGMSMADTAAMADKLAGTSRSNEAELEEIKRTLEDPNTVRMDLYDILEQPNYAMGEDEEGQPRWKPRVIESKTKPAEEPEGP